VERARPLHSYLPTLKLRRKVSWKMSIISLTQVKSLIFSPLMRKQTFVRWLGQQQNQKIDAQKEHLPNFSHTLLRDAERSFI
jgi:hypothetical protein